MHTVFLLCWKWVSRLTKIWLRIRATDFLTYQRKILTFWPINFLLLQFVTRNAKHQSDKLKIFFLLKWNKYQGFFLRRFRDPIRVPRISNRVRRIRKSYHRVPKIRKNRVPRIREIGSLQIQTGFLTFSLKKPANIKSVKDPTKLEVTNHTRKSIQTYKRNIQS